MSASAKEAVQDLARRAEAQDPTAIDELIAVDMVNHSAGPQ